MIYPITVTPAAKADIFEISAWFLENNRQNAEKWLWKVSEAITSLRKFPMRCPVAKESSAFNVEVRQLLFGGRPNMYKLLFTLRRNEVFVLRVRSTRQRPLDSETDT